MPLALIVCNVSVNPLLPVHHQVMSLHGTMPGRTGPLDWVHAQSAAIEYVENQMFSYYVRVRGTTIPLVVACTADGQKYLKARCDADLPDTLLNLPWLNSPALGLESAGKVAATPRFAA